MQLTLESCETADAKATEEFVSPAASFYPELAELCNSRAPQTEESRALVVGSGIGRLACLVSPAYKEVVAQDYCGVFTEAGKRLVETVSVTVFSLHVESRLMFRCDRVHTR